MILRELFVMLGLDVNEASFAKGQLAASVLKAGLDKLVDVAKETVTKFVEVVQQTAEAGKELEETSQATGLTTRSLQELRGVAKASGVEVGDFDTAIFKLSRSMYAAKKGGDEQSKVFAKLKVKVTESNGELKNADDVLLGVASAFAGMHDGAEKTALAMELLGRNAGPRMIAMLNKGEDGINALRSSAFVMSEEQIRAGKELTRTQMQLSNMTTKLWRGAIAPMLPAINDLLKRYLAWRKQNAEIMRQRIEKYIGYAIAAVRGLANAFSFLLRNMKVIEVAIGALTIALGILQAAAIRSALAFAVNWLIAAAPLIAIGAIVAGFMLLLDDIRVYQKGGKSLFGRFKNEIDNWLKPNAKDPWWLAVMKDLVRFMEKALYLSNKLMTVANVVNPLATKSDANAEVAKMFSARFNAPKPTGFVNGQAAYTPAVRPSGGMSAPVQMSQSNQFSIVQQPGESSEALAQRVGDLVSKQSAAQWEEAAAAVGN